MDFLEYRRKLIETTAEEKGFDPGELERLIDEHCLEGAIADWHITATPFKVAADVLAVEVGGSRTK